MVSIHNNRRPLQRSTNLSCTDEFWLAPIMAMSGDAAQRPQIEDGACSSSMDLDDKQRGGSSSSSVVSSSLPPAHHQLLIDDESPAFTSLKGYDHTASQDDVVCYSSDSEEDDDDDDEIDDTDTSCSSRQKVSSVKQQGGGSWLLGFARLNQDDTSKVTAATTTQEEKDEDFTPPGLVRVPSGSSLESEVDDDQSTSTSSSSRSSSSTKRRGVSFSSAVSIQPIPHSSSLSPTQRRKMYSTSYEVRLNKIRNKKEYRYDGYDWRNVTEEWEMGVDMVTGELIHPVHEHS